VVTLRAANPQHHSASGGEIVRKWLAGLLSSLANRLYPPYPERMRRAAAAQGVELRTHDGAYWLITGPDDPDGDQR
jgi:hypothetical protein